ncbi:Peptidoglycan D,D-transpeptidase FtsI [Streptomyces californicus]
MRGPDLSTLEKNEPMEMSQAVSPETAKKVQEMMESTAKEGSAKRALIDGVTVGGKTGTAQRGVNVRDEVPYGWFVSYGKKDDGRSDLVAAFIDPTDMDISRSDISGGRLGAPIAKSVMEAVLRDDGAVNAPRTGRAPGTAAEPPRPHRPQRPAPGALPRSPRGVRLLPARFLLTRTLPARPLRV